jgi:hypothetical protein
MGPLCGRFAGTLELSDSLCLGITVVSVGFTVRPLWRETRSDTGPPESRTQCCRACQGSATPPGAGTPCQSGVPAVAFRVFGARRPPGLARLRGSLPCLHVPLSTLHGPRYRGSRRTRGQRGWLNLRCRRLALLHIVPVCLGTPWFGQEVWADSLLRFSSPLGRQELPSSPQGSPRFDPTTSSVIGRKSRYALHPLEPGAGGLPSDPPDSRLRTHSRCWPKAP